MLAEQVAVDIIPGPPDANLAITLHGPDVRITFVRAEICGPLALHPVYRTNAATTDTRWSVTHIQSGLQIAVLSDRGVALRLVRQIRNLDWNFDIDPRWPKDKQVSMIPEATRLAMTEALGYETDTGTPQPFTHPLTGDPVGDDIPF